MEFHHVGIPTQTKREGETYLEKARLFVTDAAASPFKIEWLRFEPDSPMPEQLKTSPHVAFVVQDMDAALEGREVLIEPFQPMEGITVAFIMHDGAPVEFMKVE